MNLSLSGSTKKQNTLLQPDKIYDANTAIFNLQFNLIYGVTLCGADTKTHFKGQICNLTFEISFGICTA